MCALSFYLSLYFSLSLSLFMKTYISKSPYECKMYFIDKTTHTHTSIHMCVSVILLIKYIFHIHIAVTYWPSAELSNKRCTCVNNWCIQSKISGYNLDCGWVELGADVTPTRSRWASNNYITRCHRQVQLVGDKML